MARRRKKKSKPITQQVKDIQNRVKKTIGEISLKQEKVVTSIMILAQTRAAYYTPQDTNALINSQYRRIIKQDKSKVVGRVGYVQDYALALHERNDWMPRPPNMPGKRGGGYNPNASPHYLKRGFDDEMNNIKKVIIEMNKI